MLINGDKFQSSGMNRIVKYSRTDETTETLTRFLKQLTILQHLSNTFSMNMPTVQIAHSKGKYKGVFRIPQLSLFLSAMSRKLSNKGIIELPRIISGHEGIQKSLLLLDKLGTELARLYELHGDTPKFIETSRAEVSNLNPQLRSDIIANSPMDTRTSQQKRKLGHVANLKTKVKKKKISK